MDLCRLFFLPSPRRKPGSRATSTLLHPWIPACAGMTKEEKSHKRAIGDAPAPLADMAHLHGEVALTPTCPARPAPRPLAARPMPIAIESSATAFQPPLQLRSNP